MACIRFPSECNVGLGNALALMPQEKLTGSRFYSSYNVFLGNGFVVVIEGELACVRFPSWCNVVFGNALVLVL